MFTYSCLRGKGDDHDGRIIEVVEERLKGLVRHLLSGVEVDERWYLEVNSDVREAIEAGNMISAKDHYVVAGYFEDRWPRPIEVDEDWYFKNYPDVANAIRNNEFTSARQHFAVNGFLEGRIPFRGWTLFSDSENSRVDLKVQHLDPMLRKINSR